MAEFPGPEAAGVLKGLNAAWRRGSLVFFVGAGASQAYGLPGWRSLVLDLLAESDSSRFLEEQATPYQRAFSSWVADYFTFDLTTLASAVRAQGSSAQFVERLRKLLYTVHQPPAKGEPTILRSIAKLSKRHPPAAIITFNFDDLLEQELRAEDVDHYSVWKGNWRGHGIPVIHAHGFLPREGELDSESIVFAEDDYHQLTQQLFHWSQVEIIQCLRKHTALFVGLSMSDPNLRRLLDVWRREQRQVQRTPHWVIQKPRELPPPHKLIDVVADIQRRASEYGAAGASALGPTQIEAALRNALEMGNHMDRRLLTDMMVMTVSVRDFGAIPAFIDAIAPAPARIHASELVFSAPAPLSAAPRRHPREDPVDAPPPGWPGDPRPPSGGAPSPVPPPHAPAAGGGGHGTAPGASAKKKEPPPLEPAELQEEAGAPARGERDGGAQRDRLPPPPPPAPSPVAKPRVDPADPQKGQWGGRSEAHGRKLTATVLSLGASWFSIELEVAATPGAPPLEGEVTFHLHNTFAMPVMKATAKDGRARLKLEAYGAFTVGVEADGGETRLELDLASDEVDAPPEFKLS